MSYHGLGQAPGRDVAKGGPITGLPSLPDPSAAAKERRHEFDADWMYIEDDRVLSGLSGVLFRRKATDTSVPARVHRNDWLGNGGERIGESEPFLMGLKSLWIRLGRNPTWWPGARNEYNFGPNTNAEQTLRISEELYNLIKNPNTPLWLAASDGFVRLSKYDSLYKNDVRNALVRAGYMAANAPVAVNDDSAMVQGLKRWWDDARASGRDIGAWAGDRSSGGCPASQTEQSAIIAGAAAFFDPSAAVNFLAGSNAPGCFNFGPNVGDEVRVSPKLLADVLTNMSAREQQVAQAALAGVKIRPPVIGMLTNLSGKKVPAFSAAILSSINRSGIASTFRPMVNLSLTTGTKT